MQLETDLGRNYYYFFKETGFGVLEVKLWENTLSSEF